MQSPTGNNYIIGNNYMLFNFLLVIVVLLLFFAIYGITTRGPSGGSVEVETPFVREGPIARIVEQKEQLDTLEPEYANDTKNNGSEVNEIESRIKLVKKLLNGDEAKIMEIVFENEGVTQDSLHFRTNFSHSKLSMIIKKLEKKDLIIREKFGKTYKIYISNWVKNQ